MRQISRQYGRELYCHRNLPSARITGDMTLFQAIQRLTLAQKRAVMQWLTRLGPFWDEARMHSEDDYLECGSQIVTDSALGEAAMRNLRGSDCRLVSVSPSEWERSPLMVCWRTSAEEIQEANVENYWQTKILESVLASLPAPVTSWQELGAFCKTRFPDLTFSSDTFHPLFSHPFVPGAALRILETLHVLNRFKSCFNEHSTRTPEGQRLYQEHFTGAKAWFSDSSDHEKSIFKKELTFNNPEIKGQSIFCPWHGKIKTPQLRIHFSWPVRADEELYVVYVGPKITKR